MKREFVHVRNAAELARGDGVRTLSGRSAVVERVTADERVDLVYAEGDKVSLPVCMVMITSKAAPAPLPKDFFRGGRG